MPTKDAAVFFRSGWRWRARVLFRRHVVDGKLAYLTTWCPAGTSTVTLLAVEGRRWAIEDASETAKTELGVDHNETRSWHGWHRHVLLVMLAFAVLAVTRHRANAAVEETTPAVSRTPPLVRWSLQEVRRIHCYPGPGAGRQPPWPD